MTTNKQQDRIYSTRDNAIQALIVDPIEATGVVPDAWAEYDVEGIASHIVEVADGQPIPLIATYNGHYAQMCDADTFWAVVQHYAYEQE